MKIVVPVEPLPARIEAVGILHEKLPAAYDPGPGARLVSELRLNLVPYLRHVAIGSDMAFCNKTDNFFVGRGEYQGTIFYMKHRLSERFDAPCLLPKLERIQCGKMEFLSADRIHFFTDDLHDFLHQPVAERQERVDAGSERPDHPGAQHELVARDNRIRRNFFYCWNKAFAQSHEIRK